MGILGKIVGGLFDAIFGDDDNPDYIERVDDDDLFQDDGEFNDEPNIREAEDGTLFIDTTSGNDTIIIKPDGDFYSGKN